MEWTSRVSWSPPSNSQGVEHHQRYLGHLPGLGPDGIRPEVCQHCSSAKYHLKACTYFCSPTALRPIAILHHIQSHCFYLPTFIPLQHEIGTDRSNKTMFYFRCHVRCYVMLYYVSPYHVSILQCSLRCMHMHGSIITLH